MIPSLRRPRPGASSSSLSPGSPQNPPRPLDTISSQNYADRNDIYNEWAVAHEREWELGPPDSLKVGASYSLGFRRPAMTADFAQLRAGINVPLTLL